MLLLLVWSVTRCLTIPYMVQYQNHMVGARSKSIPRGIISHLQITCLGPPKVQTGNPIDLLCPPPATAPSPALKTDCSLPVLKQRNQWCPHAQREGWDTIGLLYLSKFLSLLNSGHLRGQANHCLLETVRKTPFLSHFSNSLTMYYMLTLVLL